MASFEALEAAALAGAQPDTRLEVVIEPTGPAWLPVVVWFSARGHMVYRVSSQKAADLRRFLSRHAKSNGIDALTLARLALIDPDGLRPVALPAGAAASLDRRVRTCPRLTEEIGTRKSRIRDLARQAMPTVNAVLARDLDWGADPLEWLEWERSRPAGSRLEFQRQLTVMDEQLVDAGQMLSKRDDQVDLLQKVLLTGLYTGGRSRRRSASR